MDSTFTRAKHILSRGLSFRIPAERGLFPPRHVLNAFFACGRDDAPADDVIQWDPFSLSVAENARLLAWWRQQHPFVKVRHLGVHTGDFSEWFTRALRVRRQ